jgi:hypothetical protein
MLSPKKRLQRSLLGWANVILGSLAVVVPPAGLIQEFKETYEQAVDDAEQERVAREEEEPPEPRPMGGGFEL